MSDWNDLFVRTSLSETSPEGRVGGLSSPDIIPYGIIPVDPSTFTSDDSYKNFVSTVPFQQGQPNYIYVRAKNSSPTTAAKGQAFLVLTNPAVVLWPGGDGWTQILTNNGLAYSSLDPSPTGSGAIAVTTDPFVYKPLDSGHRCLVTWLSTQAHPVPAPPPRITDMNALVKFLIDHPNYAHHNIDIAPDTTGAVTTTKPFNSGTQPFSWRVGLQVTNCKGFDVSFSSSEPLEGGGYITMKPVTVQQDDTIAYLLGPFNLPASWDTQINYTYQTHGLSKDNFSVTLVAYFDVDPTHELWHHAKPYTELGIPAQHAPKDRRGITVGSVAMMKGVTDQ
ncbi:MAG: hypothetical protein M3Q40_02800 [Pseudomonadota bacterium]|nr:hypothetical protein [Pseudomonadota bacterium]